jgi:hypothetical protein
VSTALDPHSIFEAEIARVLEKMRKFLLREPSPSTFEKTCEYFEGAYGIAFDKLTVDRFTDTQAISHLAATGWE